MQKKTKYRSRKVVFDGMTFDSKKEFNRWVKLCDLQSRGLISDLRRQVKFILIPTQRIDGKVVERECAYYADFVYVNNLTEKTVVEDTKGFRTKDYVIKRKLLLQKYGIRIKEI